MGGKEDLYQIFACCIHVTQHFFFASIMEYKNIECILRVADFSDTEDLLHHNLEMALETEQLVLEKDLVRAGVQTLLLRPEKGFYLIAEISGKIAGSLMITYEWSDWRNSDIWWIQSVFVRPEFRRMGVYTALHTEIVKMGKEKGAGKIRLYAERDNIEAHKTYIQQGMEPSHYLLFEQEIG